MAEIRWTQEAVQWLHNINEYISIDNPEAGQKIVQGLVDKVQVLHDFPQIGYSYRHEHDGEVRILLYGHYRIAYLIKPDVIDILGIFHGALQIENYIQ